MKLANILFLIFYCNLAFGQDLDTTDSGPVADDISLETEKETAMRHYESCDLKRKYADLKDPKRDEKLKEEYKNKEKKIASCVPYAEYLEKIKDGEGAKSVYLEICKNNYPLACVRMGNVLTDEGNGENATEMYKRACDLGFEEGCVKLKFKKEESDLLLYTSLILVGLATFIVTQTMFQEEGQFKASETMQEGQSGKDDIGKHGIILKYSRPFFRRYVSPIVSSMKNKKKIKEKYRRKLASAGLTDTLSTEDFFSFKLFLIIGFPIVFLGVRAFMETDWPLSAIPFVAGVGFIYPDIWVNGKIGQRQKEIIIGMPFCVDMLALSVEAGLDFIAAMGKVIDKAKPSALTEEFGIVIKEIRIGSSRADALRALAWRTDLIQISSFTATLIAADSVGASIGPILKSLAVEIRQKKSSDAEKAGATAATKILFPMLLFITPAVFLVIAAPMILEAMGLKGK